MKKILISIFVFFVPFLLILFFAPKETYAQGQYWCDSGDYQCKWDCEEGFVPNCSVDGQTGLCTGPFTKQDCIPTYTPPPKEEEEPVYNCTGESTNLPGMCKWVVYGCSPNPPYWFDGKGGCGFAKNCCVMSGETKPTPPKKIPGLQDPAPFDLKGLEKEVYEEGPLSSFKFASGSLGDVVSGLLFLLFPLAGILLLFYLVIGGIQLMLSAGDPKAIESAKGKITNALIGFLIIFVAYWLVQIIGRILGIEAIRSIF